MKGNEKLLKTLNALLSEELTAINQYMVHSEMSANWGYEKLHKHFEKQAIDEMKHAEKLIGRILFLEGLPNLQRLGKINVGQTVKEMLELDYQIEKSSVQMCNDFIKKCLDANDGGSRELIEHILVDSEEHANWLEAQLDLIRQVGEQNYLAQQIRD